MIHRTVPCITAYINKNDTVTQTLNGENAPETDVQDELASPVSNKIIPQNAEKSNTENNNPEDSELSVNVAKSMERLSAFL